MKLNKILIVSLLLLTIIAMGTVSASEDISDDAITAIEPSEEAIDASLEEVTDSSDEESVDSSSEETIGSSSEELEIDEETLSSSDKEDAKLEINSNGENENDEIEVDVSNPENGMWGIEDYEEAPFVEIRTNGEQEGNITILIDEETQYNYTISKGSMLLEIIYSNLDSLSLGKHNMTLTFIPTDGESKTFFKEFEVDYFFRIYPGEDNEEYYGENIVFYDDLRFNIRIPENATGTLSYTFNGKTYEARYNNGTYKDGFFISPYLSVENLNIGTHKITASLTGDSEYPNKTIEWKFRVIPKINIPDIYSIGDNDYIEIILPNNYSGNVNVYNGTLYPYSKDSLIKTIKVVNGHARFYLNETINGVIIFINCSGSGDYEQYYYYTPITNNNKFSASLAASTIERGSSAHLKISNSTSSHSMYIYVDNKLFKTISLSDAIDINQYIPNLGLGEHKIKVIVGDNDEQHYEYAKTLYLTVKEKSPVATKLTSSKVSIVYNSAVKTLSATLKDAKGNAVSGKVIIFAVNGKTYKAKTNAKGVASVKLPVTWVPKTYKASIKFAGDKDYKASSVSANVVVSKANVKLTAAKKTFKVKTKVKKVTATLKNNKGKVMKGVRLTIKIGKRSYAATTNKKGVATFKVKLSKKGKYTGTIKFKTNKYFKAASKKVKITVK